MLKFLVLPFLFLLILEVKSQDKYTLYIDSVRKEINKEFKNPETSILKGKDLKKFKKLKFFPADSNFRVVAKFIPYEEKFFFKMKTSTSRLPEYSKYGKLVFTLLGKEYELQVYHNQELLKRPGYEDFLLVPFTDLTTGKETYEVGRYLDFRIPKTDTIVLDFNLCYNPYCAYSNAYSCPIPPEENHLPLRITAGVMKYKK